MLTIPKDYLLLLVFAVLINVFTLVNQFSVLYLVGFALLLLSYAKILNVGSNVQQIRIYSTLTGVS